MAEPKTLYLQNFWVILLLPSLAGSPDLLLPTPLGLCELLALWGTRGSASAWLAVMESTVEGIVLAAGCIHRAAGHSYFAKEPT